MLKCLEFLIQDKTQKGSNMSKLKQREKPAGIGATKMKGYCSERIKV